jgi:hypothetical protein
VTVHVGMGVSWINKDEVAHSITGKIDQVKTLLESMIGDIVLGQLMQKMVSFRYLLNLGFIHVLFLPTSI